MAYATDGPLPRDTAGFPVQGVYVPNTGTVALQGGSVLVDSNGAPYAPELVQLSSSSVSPLDGTKASYAASITALAPAASATDIFTITGSATKTIRVTRVEVSGIATSIIDTAVALVVRSTANATGTSTTPAAVPYDSTSAAASAVVRAYTVNPGTLGTTVGSIRSSKLLFNLVAPTAGSESGRLIEDFGDRPTQAVVLRGTTQVLAVNLNGVTVSGGSIDVSVEWTEE